MKRTQLYSKAVETYGISDYLTLIKQKEKELGK
jgi:hypothetical protein